LYSYWLEEDCWCGSLAVRPDAVLPECAGGSLFLLLISKTTDNTKMAVVEVVVGVVEVVVGVVEVVPVVWL